MNNPGDFQGGFARSSHRIYAVLVEMEGKMSAMAGKLAAVIPAYREEAIGSVVLKTLGQVDGVVVVDDGSTGAPAQIAKAAGAMVISLYK